MSDTPPKQFQSPEEMMAFLSERSDDMNGISIYVPEAMPFVGPQGQQARISGVAAILRMADGSRHLIHFADLQMLLNDGLLNRMRVPIEVTPIPKI